MKRNSCQAILAFILLVLLTSCDKEQETGPQLTTETTREAVKGKWSISKIDYQLCRSGNCTRSSYTGNARDYFELRADSAFLVRHGVTSTIQADRFRVYYNQPGAFTLSNGTWTGRFDIKVCKAKELVLINTFTGTDPYAAFTDTYYLYKK